MNKLNVIMDKVYRKLNYIFWHRVHPGKWSLYLFVSYRHYKFHKNISDTQEKKENLYLTQEPNHGAGIGHQLANWNSGYYYAKVFGLKYAYSSFPNKMWDEFLGFGQAENSVEQLVKKGYKKRKLPYFNENSEEEKQLICDIIDSYDGEKIVFVLGLDQVYSRQCDVMEDIRYKFEHAVARQKDKLIYNPDCLNIAVHIRRGDIVIGQENNDPALTKRWLDTEYYVHILKKIQVELQKKGIVYKIYLFSQGEKADFSELGQVSPVEFCLDMPPRESFLHMVKADILITSKSSFSYKPALLSRGLRICPEHFWHAYPIEKEWILIDEEQGITQEQVDTLVELIDAKPV